MDTSFVIKLWNSVKIERETNTNVDQFQKLLTAFVLTKCSNFKLGL